MCFNKIRSELVAIYFSCIDENGKRSDQKTLSNTTKVDHVVGSDQAKKRSSVLIQILKVENSDQKPFGNVLKFIATATGFSRSRCPGCTLLYWNKREAFFVFGRYCFHQCLVTQNCRWRRSQPKKSVAIVKDTECWGVKGSFDIATEWFVLIFVIKANN